MTTLQAGNIQQSNYQLILYLGTTSQQFDSARNNSVNSFLGGGQLGFPKYMAWAGEVLDGARGEAQVL